MSNINHLLVVDVETVPNLHLVNEVLGTEYTSFDEEVEGAFNEYLQSKYRNTFPPAIFHEIVTTGFLLVTTEKPDSGNNEVLEIDIGTEEDFHIIAEGLNQASISGTIVTHNGVGFDLPVIRYNALRQGLVLSYLFQVGKDCMTNRYNARHIDLADQLSSKGATSRPSLDLLSKSLGLAGKIGVGGASVLDSYRNGDLDSINKYCEVDILNTFFCLTQYLKLTGTTIGHKSMTEIEKATVNKIVADNLPHQMEFLNNSPRLFRYM